jgi:hypothetical protein
LAIRTDVLAALEPPIDKDLAALDEVLVDCFGEPVPRRNPEPFRFFLNILNIAAPTAAAVIHRQTKVGYGGAAWRVTHLGVLTDVADQEDLVQAQLDITLLLGLRLGGLFGLFRLHLFSPDQQVPLHRLINGHLPVDLDRAFRFDRKSGDVVHTFLVFIDRVRKVAASP